MEEAAELFPNKKNHNCLYQAALPGTHLKKPVGLLFPCASSSLANITHLLQHKIDNEYKILIFYYESNNIYPTFLMPLEKQTSSYTQ